MANFYSIITNRGKELEAEALASGTKITLVKFVVGDGNGQATPPKPTQTKLVNEKYRGDIGDLSVSPEQSTQMMAKIVLPTNVGGFTVREIGILTDAGELYAVANCAAIEKPVGGVSVNMQFRLAVSDTANITLNVATGDGLFLRIDQDLSEIRGRGAQAQKTARESLAVVDASTKQKGLVQLNSATNSTSETQAATPAAVKAANDNAITRLEKNKNLSDVQDKGKARANLELVKQTSSIDATTGAVLSNGAWGLGSVVVPIPDSADIYTYFLTAKTGFYRIGQLVTNGVFKGADFIWALHSVNLATGKAAYGNLYELSTDGVGSAIHTLNAGEWSVSRNYSDKYKPTASDVGALPANGNAVSATKLATARKIAGKAFDGTADIVITAGDVDALPISGGTLTGNLGVKYQLQVGSVGSGVLNIGDANSGLRSSTKGQVDLFANGRMYGYWNATELAFSGQIIPTNYTNFDAKYQPIGNYQPSGNYALVGASYTKVESDNRYYTKAVSDSAYAPANWSYSKAASDTRYVQGVQLGAETRMGSGSFISEGVARIAKVPAGCTMTSVGDNNASGNLFLNDIDFVGYKPIQRNINGTWVTISG